MTASDGADASADQLARRIADRTVELGYRTWDWGEGVAQYALLRAGQVFGEDRYIDEVAAFMRDNRGLRPVRVEQIMPSLAAVLLHEHTGDPLPLELAMRVADMLRTHPRSQHGAFIATPVRSVWVDYIYETTPFLVHLGRITGDPAYRIWAIDQTLAYLMSCWNARERLFHHVYYDDVAAANPFMWSRANGWSALGLVEMHDLLPEESGLHPMLRRILGQLLARLEQLQHSSGHWHTVLTDPRTYLEASGTAMISLATKRAVRSGLVDPSLDSMADRAWSAVVDVVEKDGTVSGVSAETPPGDADFYQGIPLGTHPWGQGFVLLAALDRVSNGG